MNKPLIINVALTGCLFGKEDNENLPVTIKEIVRDASVCYDLGASIFHIHARDEHNFAPTWRPDVYAELIERLRSSLPEDAILCVSCSGRHWEDYEKRAAVLELDGIDMASLTIGDVRFSTGVSTTTKAMVGMLSQKMQDRGIRPEIEVFDMDMAYFLRAMHVSGWLADPLYVNIFIGVVNGMRVAPSTLIKVVDMLPDHSVWAATGAGKYQFEVNCWAVAMGGHVRVGLEDSLWMEKGLKATNGWQVARIVEVGKSMGRKPATAEEARGLIWLQ